MTLLNLYRMQKKMANELVWFFAIFFISIEYGYKKKQTG